MRFIIFVADLTIEISSVYLQIWYLCRNYIIRNDAVNNIIPDLYITTTKEEIALFKERFSKSLAIDYGPDSDDYIECALVHMKITERLLDRNIILMHGSVVVTNHKAYMLTGPSGVGKTYRSKLWLKHIPGSYFLNGDKPFLIIRGNKVYACGSPWCGKERYSTNKLVPLCAIFLLERSNKTSIKKISLEAAFNELMMQTYHPLDNSNILTTIRLLNNLNGKVNIYRFNSTKEPESVLKAFEIASKEAIPDVTKAIILN